jgi:hypothetical protein
MSPPGNREGFLFTGQLSPVAGNRHRHSRKFFFTSGDHGMGIPLYITF